MTNIESNITREKGFEKSLYNDKYVVISSRISVSGALELARRFENIGKIIIVILPDVCEPCLSTGIYPPDIVKAKATDLFWSF